MRKFAHSKVMTGHQFGTKTAPEGHHGGQGGRSNLGHACDWLQESEGREAPAKAKELESKGELGAAQSMAQKNQDH